MQKIGMESQGRFRVYHGTNARFEQFSLDYAARPGMAGNGHLGIWLAVERSLAEKFGVYCLEVEIQVDRAYPMPLSELVRLHNDCNRETEAFDYGSIECREREKTFYTNYRENLLAQGYDTVYLVESEGAIHMVIGLQPHRLHIHEPLLQAA